MNETLPERFAARMGQLLGPHFPSDIALAVSGGGDSMAMLTLAHEWARVFGVKLWIVTVDHGLRDESANEAAMVARECASLGRPHETLRWHWDGQGNLQDAARRARLELIDGWRGALRHVLMGHTQDDVAETFLMRLARGSGVEGLSAIEDRREVRLENGTFEVIRPLLHEARADLRHHIDTLKVPCVDDPSNDDPRFDRVKARNALASLGIDSGTLAATAGRMRRASEALAHRAADVARDCVVEDQCNWMPTGDLLIDRDRFAAIEEDTQRRIFAAALQWVASAPYRPRASALENLIERAQSGGGGTLHGARVIVSGATLRVTREFAAVQDLSMPLTEHEVTWDGRWHVCSTAPDGLTLRALGPDGWKQTKTKPGDLPPHDAAITLPAVFRGAQLVAWHPAETMPEFQVRFAPPTRQFITFLESR